MRQLIGLSDADLLSRTEALCGDARQVLASVLVCIGEIEERKLHIDAACPRFVEFCAQRFRMSESEAFRRIVAARIVKKYPHVLARLERGEIHMTALYLLDDYLTAENHEQLIAEACGKSKRHLKELIAAWFPQPDVPNRVVPVVNEMTPTALPFVAPLERAVTTTTTATNAAATRTTTQDRATVEPLSSTRYKFEFTGDVELRGKIEEATALLRHVNPSGEMAVVIDRALDVLIADLKKKKHAETNRPQKRRSTLSADPSYIPAATRRDVYTRDENRCTFVSVDGRRCTSTERIEIDHIVPLARGGMSDLGNLRLACRPHNQFFAEQAFGREHVAEQIELRRRNRRASMGAALVSDVTPLQSTMAIDSSARQNGETDSPALPVAQLERDTISETLLSGLVNLGFRANDARRAVDVVLTRNPRNATPADLPSMICEALAILT